jgi:hypothetical protein
MSHPIVLALYDDAAATARAARALREMGIPRDRVSILARSHEEAGKLADAVDASPGVEIEDSRPAAVLGELSAHFLAAIAVVMPGIGPIVADGPLAAELGEAAGHLAGGLAKVLTRAGLSEAEAKAWEARIQAGSLLLGAHTETALVPQVQDAVYASGARDVAVGRWDS